MRIFFYTRTKKRTALFSAPTSSRKCFRYIWPCVDTCQAFSFNEPALLACTSLWFSASALCNLALRSFRSLGKVELYITHNLHCYLSSFLL